MQAANAVEFREHGGGRQALAIDGDDIAALVFELDHLGAVGRLARRIGDAPHRFLGLEVRVLEDAALVGDVQQVGVHGVGRCAAAFLEVHGYAVLVGVLQQLFTRQQVPLAPGRYHADIGHQRIGAQLEAHLVVALAGGAVRDGVGAGLAGQFHHALGDERPRDGRSQQVLALVDRVGAEHGENEIAHERFAQVLDEDVGLADAHLQGLEPRRLQLFTLADIGGKGDDLALVDVLQPLEDDRCVEAARIRQHDFFYGVLHGGLGRSTGGAHCGHSTWCLALCRLSTVRRNDCRAAFLCHCRGLPLCRTLACRFTQF